MFSDMESYLLRGVEGDPLFDLFLGMLSLSQSPDLEKDCGVSGEHWLTEFLFYLLEVPNSEVHAARLGRLPWTCCDLVSLPAFCVWASPHQCELGSQAVTWENWRPLEA